MRGGRLATFACWAAVLAVVLAVDSLRNFSGMLIHDFLCHRETRTYRLCHENPTVLAFWDSWRGFKASTPSTFVTWLRTAEDARSPLHVPLPT